MNALSPRPPQVPAGVLDEPRAFKYWLSPDKQYLLMAIRPQKLFRHTQHHEIIGFVYILEVF